ncbi:MAG: hypothetical protein K1X86_15835 [Ignavibacteria bacterium]|nr:hypothetical protein [Ignavibacteria bacterium]
MKHHKISKKDFKNPILDLINNLRSLSSLEIKKHRLNPHKEHFNNIKKGIKKTNWASYAETHLFKSKRYKGIASLLNIKRMFQKHNFFDIKKLEDLKKVLEFSDIQDAIQQPIRKVKSDKVGINIMDIVICGSIPPIIIFLGES